MVAAGDSVYGAWEISAQRQPGGDLSTRIRLTEPDGRVVWLGGSDGPAVWPGRVLNVGSGGQAAAGPYEVDVRVPSRVRAVTVTTAEGNVLAVALHDSAAFPEVRFGLLLVDRALRLSHVTAYDDGRPIERFDLTVHQHVWHDR